ncbi:MAG: cupin domain-containing protein [Burkholderiales bacterium]|nr:cupin domain-containing protein [Burkholderiales bacterium]
MQTQRYFVSEADVTPYSPANHEGTVNRRLIGPETVGSQNIELLLGVLSGEGSRALPHMHPGIDQVCYMLQGRAVAEVGGQTRELGPGDACFFPAGEFHTFTKVSEEPVRVLVMYTPPYGESKDKAVTRG